MRIRDILEKNNQVDIDLRGCLRFYSLQDL